MTTCYNYWLFKIRRPCDRGDGHQNGSPSDKLDFVVGLADLVSIWCPKRAEIESKPAKG